MDFLKKIHSWRDRGGNSIYGNALMLFIVLGFVGIIIWGIGSAIAHTPPQPKRVCEKSYFAERRFGFDVNLHTLNKKKARSLAGDSRIYIDEECHYE